ncbi:MAG: PadR family transcriptional regulator [Mycobacteriales bacterium]
MSATRLIVLGAVRTFQPVHGYFVRRELLSWGVETWAHVHPGSIYNALRSLDHAGEIDVVDTENEGARPARTRYRLTTDGEKAFFTLLRDALWTVQMDPSALFAGLMFASALRREEVIDAMTARCDKLRAASVEIKHASQDAAEARTAPAHTQELWNIGAARLGGELRWCRAYAGRLRAGHYRFYPEPGWNAPPGPEGRWDAQLWQPIDR